MGKFILVSVLFLLLSSFCYANDNLSLELHDTDLCDAIHIVAKFLRINVIISPTVHGLVNLTLHDALPSAAFHLLLASHHLVTWQIGNIYYIGPEDELVKRKQEEIKWQEIKEKSSPLSTRVWQIRYGNAKDMVNLFREGQENFLSKRGQLFVDIRTNTIGVQDIREKIDTIHQLIKRLDVPVKQVLIKARLASVDSDVERELGIRFISAPASLHNDANKITETGQYSIAIAKLAGGSFLDVKLAALENSGRAELISSPSLFTANQQPASIEAGEEVPYQEVSESGGTAVAFKKAVLGLKVTPQILPNNHVLLHLQINQDRPSHRMVLGMPTISTRQIITHVLAKVGQTIVLGGIFESNQEKGSEGIPFIDRIPGLGLLFKQNRWRENKRELLIFITPTIIQANEN